MASKKMKCMRRRSIMKNKKYDSIKKRITMVIAVVMAMTLTACGKGRS